MCEGFAARFLVPEDRGWLRELLAWVMIECMVDSCSFCARPKYLVSLYRGPNVAICRECVEFLFHEVEPVESEDIAGGRMSHFEVTKSAELIKFSALGGVNISDE